MTRVCKICLTDKALTEFKFHKREGKIIYHRSCKGCGNRKSDDQRDVERRRAWAREYCAVKRIRYPDKTLLADCRGADRKAGRRNDLTIEIVRQLISTGCSYCGDTETRMSLDRIDNSKGHEVTNVVPSCVRCNMIKGAMPHEAWIEVSKGVKVARVKGLFGTWVGGNKSKRSGLA